MKSKDGKPIPPFVPRVRPVFTEDRIDLVPLPLEVRTVNHRKLKPEEYSVKIILEDPVYKTYLNYYGLSKDAWDEERNGPIESRCEEEVYMFAAYHFPHQHVRMGLNRDPTKFIFIMVLMKTVKMTPMVFYIRNSLLDNSQFDALQMEWFPERTFRAPPTRFWHWVAGYKPQIKARNPDGTHSVVFVNDYPMFDPSDFDMINHPHEIGLLSNRRYDGTIIDPSVAEPEDRGAFIYVCDPFHPVDQHEIEFTFFYTFPYPLKNQHLPTVVDPVTGEKKTLDPRKIGSLPTPEEFSRMVRERDADPATRIPRRQCKKAKVPVENAPAKKTIRKPKTTTVTE